jgi:polyphosphate kinase
VEDLVEIVALDKRLVSAEEQRYFSRELSMLQFHERVLDQTRRGAHPLLERLKFLAIADSNLDEFLSIQFSLLLGNVEVGDTTLTPDGNTQTEQLRRVRGALARFMDEQRRIFHQELIPDLAEAGIHFCAYRDLAPLRQEELRQWFLNEVFPVCTPLAVDPAHPFPFISNLSLNLGVVLWETQGDVSFARIKVPAVLPRLVRVRAATAEGRESAFVWLEDIIANNLDAFFLRLSVRDIFLFRLVRDAEMELRELESVSLRETVQAGIRQRRFGETVCVQLERAIPDVVAKELITRLDVYPEDVYVVGPPLGLRDLAQLTDLDRPDLKDPVLLPRRPAALTGAKDLFALIRHGDVLLHHPYESFTLVLDLIAQAAADPDVLTIKQTLYRIGRASPLVQSLLEAVDRGKQVAVVLELQARGDEESNLDWARTLERAGAHVSFGVIGLKTHGKLSLLVRREPEGLRRYVHVGTGNYTANPYADLSLFTCRPAIGADATALFNVLTGRSRQDRYEYMLVSPVSLRQEILERIGREIECHRLHGGGHLIFKTNALVDLEVIEALYAASGAGVSVDLLVRGACCLRPGVSGLSETIRVISIVGRFLEHSRVYYFRNSGREEALIGSADLMERNLDQRVEILVPVLDSRLTSALKERLLDLQLNDTVRTKELHSDGIYRRVPRGDATPVDAQLAWTAPNLSLMP